MQHLSTAFPQATPHCVQRVKDGKSVPTMLQFNARHDVVQPVGIFSNIFNPCCHRPEACSTLIAPPALCAEQAGSKAAPTVLCRADTDLSDCTSLNIKVMLSSQCIGEETSKVLGPDFMLGSLGFQGVMEDSMMRCGV